MEPVKGSFEFEDVGLVVEAQRHDDSSVAVWITKDIPGINRKTILLNTNEAHAMYNLLDVVLPEKEE